MGSFIQNNINFNNINADTVYKRSGKYTHMSNADGNKFDTSIIESELTPSFNAIEIDWNGAQLNLPEAFGGTQTISTTGQLLSVIQQLANAINNDSPEQSPISIDTVSTVNGVRSFTVSSSNDGSLTLSNIGGTLNKTAFTMVANKPQSFTLSNVGSDGETPNITFSSEINSDFGGVIHVTSDIASTIYIEVDTGGFGDMTSYSYQTYIDAIPNRKFDLQWVNPSAAITYANISAWSYSAGTTAQPINYTITAKQNTDIYSISGTLPGGTGKTTRSYTYFGFDTSYAPIQTSNYYYYYAGWTLPTSSNVDTIINEKYAVSDLDSNLNTAGKKTTSKSSMDYSINTLYNANEKTNYYVLVPAGHSIYDILDTNISDSTFTSQGNITVGNQTHTIYKSNDTSRNISAIKIK